MNDNFYRAFEEKHRGPRQLIKKRLRVYQPFIVALAQLYAGAQTIDLGCGRGEWLELLTENGFDAWGVDLDDGMLAPCRELGLQVETKDALLALQDLPDASQAIVSGFHIAEHLPFEMLLALVKQAYRVLLPAGLLILETPNAENIMVGTSGFYTDPTHQRPLPQALLEFLPEYEGFHRIKIMRLQEQQTLASKLRLDLMDVLGGSSPDYAVVAQKSASSQMLKAAAVAFDKDYGLPLDLLASRYDQQHVQQINHVQQVLIAHETEQQAKILQTRLIADEALMSHAAETKNRLANHAAEQQAKAEQTRLIADEALSHAVETKSHLARLEAAQQELIWQNRRVAEEAAQVQATLHAVLQSRSWRITLPLRWLGHQALRLNNVQPAAASRNFTGLLARRSLEFVQARPGLHRMCGALAHKLGIFHTLENAYIKVSRVAPIPSFGQPVAGELHSNQDPLPLSDRGKDIYLELEAELAHRQDKGGK